MKPSEITTNKWHIMELTGEFTSYGRNAAELLYTAGTKGYVKRNIHQPNYFQVLARTSTGSIGGDYLREDKADRIILVKREVPPEYNPQKIWKAYWFTRFSSS